MSPPDTHTHPDCSPAPHLWGNDTIIQLLQQPKCCLSQKSDSSTIYTQHRSVLRSSQFMNLRLVENWKNYYKNVVERLDRYLAVVGRKWPIHAGQKCNLIYYLTSTHNNIFKFLFRKTHILKMFFQLHSSFKNRINKMSSKIQKKTHFFRLRTLKIDHCISINIYTFLEKILFWQNALDIQTTFTDIENNKKKHPSLTLTFFKSRQAGFMLLCNFQSKQKMLILEAKMHKTYIQL